ncbi:restriction endonuclease subunit S [Gemella sp. zg-1178]|uniref:restriction endonuclease subunit S n=1 Tax=Gemella sp. zg-1178 TaxID=2840372 RepID=UPI001C03F830|nr:restriction endonuclease subunit S [Gemella sp. zg-1178]
MGLEKRKIKEIEKLKNRLINKLIKVENGNKIKIKYFCNLFGRIGWQGLNSGEYSDKGILLITGTDFKNGEINYETCVRVPYFRWEQNKNIQIKNDDLLITKDGTVGKLALVKNLKEKATLNSGIMKIEFFKDTIVTKEYLYYVLKSDIFKEWFNNLNLGVATIIHLYQRDFYNFEFFYPDIHTQEKVVIKIKNIENKFDNLLAYLESQIQNLQELKQSLISDVVTGKMDVREIEIPEEYRREN